jgi:hypothetical protein
MFSCYDSVSGIFTKTDLVNYAFLNGKSSHSVFAGSDN